MGYAFWAPVVFCVIGVLILVAVTGINGRLARLELKLDLLLDHSGVHSNIDQILSDRIRQLAPDPVRPVIPDPSQLQLSERVKQLAADPRRKIEAIKVLRQETGLDLKNAKDIVESFAATREFRA
jgi:hypothetical protein